MDTCNIALRCLTDNESNADEDRARRESGLVQGSGSKVYGIDGQVTAYCLIRRFFSWLMEFWVMTCSATLSCRAVTGREGPKSSGTAKRQTRCSWHLRAA